MLDQNVNVITDIIDMEYLQTVQDSLGRIVGITTALLDPNGVPISRPTNLHAFCAMMQASDTGVQMCMKTNGKLIEINKETREPSIVLCPNSGLMTAAVPIFFEDKYLGSWLIGQIRMENIDFDLIENTAEKAGFSKEEAKKNISMLPVISDEEFRNILNFLVTTTKTVTDLAALNTTLNKQNKELAQFAENLDASLAAFKEFINLTDIGTYLVDYETGELLMASSMYKELAGIDTDDFSGNTCYSYMGCEDFCPYCPKVQLVDENGEPTGPVVWERYNDAVDMWLSITSRALKWIDGRTVMMTTFVNITERKKEEERIAYLAYNDQLLNIPNALKLSLDIKEKCSEHCYLIFFDVKGLKNINNVYGRTAGDKLLKSIADWLREFVQGTIPLYRVSGDEFAILVADKEDHEVMEFASDIFARFESPWTVDMSGIKQHIYAGIQMGIIQAKEPVDSHSTLINLTEKVLSFARDANMPILFDEEMDRKFQDHMNLIVSLKACVLNQMEGFSLNYQPVVDAFTGKWIGMEALCRWNSPDVGNIPPNIFIDEAEKLGIISAIGSWVLEEAISQTKIWKLHEIENFTLSVNLSPIQLRDKELITDIHRILKRYNYPANRLSLEITESAEVQFDDITLKLLNSLKEAGIQLSLDDFGTGYGSFSNLKSLPISILKTDRSFIKGIEEDEYLRHTLRTMVDFAHFAGLIVVAEGVETANQHEIVRRNGANYIQGFYFSKPLTKEDLEKNLYRFR